MKKLSFNEKWTFYKKVKIKKKILDERNENKK